MTGVRFLPPQVHQKSNGRRNNRGGLGSLPAGSGPGLGRSPGTFGHRLAAGRGMALNPADTSGSVAWGPLTQRPEEH